MMHNDIRREAKAAAKQYSSQWLPLAKVLYKIKKAKLYEDWSYETWEEYVAQDLNCPVQIRETQYWCLIVKKLVIELGVLDQDIEDMGSARAKAICPVADKKNIAQWLVLAKKETYLDLRDLVREAVKKQGHEPEPKVYVPLNFRVIEEQAKTIRSAIALAAKVAPGGNKSDGHLMELIALDFISGHPESTKEFFAIQVSRLEQVFGVKLIALDKENPALPAMIQQIRAIVSGAEIETKP